MVKLFSSLVITFISLFLMWFIVALIKYQDLSNVHLDVYSSFMNLDKITSNQYLNGNTLYETLVSFKDNFIKIVNWGGLTSFFDSHYEDNEQWYNIFSSIFDPLKSIGIVITTLGYLIAFIFEILSYGFLVIFGIIDFIFNPVFVVDTSVASQAVLEKAKNLFGFAFQGVPLTL